MRINPYGDVNPLYNSKGARKTFKPSSASGVDRLEISQMGRDIQVAKNAVSAAPDIRGDKVDSIKKQIAAGTYNVSMEDVADKLINSYYNESV